MVILKEISSITQINSLHNYIYLSTTENYKAKSLLFSIISYDP